MSNSNKVVEDLSPDVVSVKCAAFLRLFSDFVALHDLWAYPPTLRRRKRQPPYPHQAAEAWTRLDDLGRELLQIGAQWRMQEWCDAHPMWGFYEQSHAFGEDAPLEWDWNLHGLLGRHRKRKTPYGFGRDQSLALSEIVEDIRREVGALLATADERIASSVTASRAKPLTHREASVLNAIPFGEGKGRTGKEIIQQLAKQGIIIGQSTLTRHTIKRLKAGYGVRNRRGAGYYRPDPL